LGPLHWWLCSHDLILCDPRPYQEVGEQSTQEHSHDEEGDRYTGFQGDRDPYVRPDSTKT
jgi:hypothetical protein